jgi:hypothetical protein
VRSGSVDTLTLPTISTFVFSVFILIHLTSYYAVRKASHIRKCILYEIFQFILASCIVLFWHLIQDYTPGAAALNRYSSPVPSISPSRLSHNNQQMNSAKLSPKPGVVNDGRFVAVMLCHDFSIGKAISRNDLSNIFLHLVKIPVRSFSPEYSHYLAAQRFTTSE